MYTSVAKYNIFNQIPKLHNASERIAGQTCWINRREKMICDDPERSNRRDGFIGYDNLGGKLVESGKLPAYVELHFPKEPEKVRDFFRLVLRTSVPFSQAAEINGVKIKDLSKVYVDF